jgi:hypothetical protein
LRIWEAPHHRQNLSVSRIPDEHDKHSLRPTVSAFCFESDITGSSWQPRCHRTMRKLAECGLVMKEAPQQKSDK